jgi:hypothetical protein
LVPLEFIMDNRAVLALDHESGLLDLNPLDFVSKHWKRIEPEPLQISISLRVHHTCIPIRG